MTNTLHSGTVVTSADIPVTPTAVENTAQSGITSTSYAAGANVCGTAFIAPVTGRVQVNFRAFLDNTTAGLVTVVSFEMREGSTVGSGTIFRAVDDNTSIARRGTNQVRGGMAVPVEGLTPAAAYNVRLMHRVTGGSGTVDDREISVQPLT